MGDFLTTHEAAAVMKIHEKTVRRMILRRDLRAVKVGKSWRIAAEDLPTAALAPREPRKARAYKPAGSVGRALAEAEMAS